MSGSNPNPNGQYGATGSITGFNIDFTLDPTLNETNFSIQQLENYLQTLESLNAPARIRMLERTIMDHVRNFNNPHQDNVGMLSPDLVATLFAQYLPGTVPQGMPVFSLQAVYEQLSTVLSQVQVTRASEINTIDQQGFLKYYGPNTSAIDWMTGRPLLPCWPAKTQVFQVLDPSSGSSENQFTAVNVVYDPTSVPGVAAMASEAQLIIREQNVQGIHAIQHNLTGVGTNEQYTFSVFVYPQYNLGTFYYQTSTGDAGYFDIRTNAIFSTPNMQVYVYPLPNGWYRLGFQYTTTSNVTGSNTFGFTTTEYASLAAAQSDNQSYIGTTNKAIFSWYGPQLTTGPGVAPFTQIGTIAATTMTLPGFDASMITSTGMMAIRFYLASGAEQDTILQINNTDIVMSSNNLAFETSVNVSTTPVTFSFTAQQDNWMTAALSYSPNYGVYAMLSGSAKQITPVQSLAYHPINAISSVSFGPFCGGIGAAEFYAVPDDDQCLEFLVGETSS